MRDVRTDSSCCFFSTFTSKSQTNAHNVLDGSLVLFALTTDLQRFNICCSLQIAIRCINLFAYRPITILTNASSVIRTDGIVATKMVVAAPRSTPHTLSLLLVVEAVDTWRNTTCRNTQRANTHCSINCSTF